MPKSAQSTLRWEPLQAKYLIIERENGASDFLSEDEADFLAFVEHHRAFAFHGRSGHLNLFKEQRRGRGEGYWYAYQRHNRRVRKHYVGRSAQMNLEYLEELASQMAQKPKTKPTFLSVAQTDQRSVQRRMLESGSTQETTRKTSEQAKNLLPMESAGEDASHAPLEPLLLPKLELPRRKPGFLPREPLLKLLDAGLSHKVTLVAGPAGYGKTTLIGQWIAARRKHADFPLVASVILDEGDNDPIRFWRYLITACQQFKAGLGKAALQWLHAYHLPSLKPLDLMLTVLLNELSQLEHPGILILDDLHTINSPQVIETLSFFLDHLPTPIHLVLLGRGDPPFLAARLRARHELLRIAPFSLRFSLEETSAFLAQALPFVPSSRNVRQIHERLEGWPAGLRFLVEILRWSEQGGDIEHILSTFSGSALSVQEYFLSEILHTLPEEQQTFLLHTCMLPLLTAPLCDTITERGESARQLEALHRGDFFLLPLDPAGEWARYYPLFGEALQQEAQRCLGEARLRELATRASQWYEAHELLPEAIEIALYAATYTRAADLLALLLERQQRANGPGAWELYRVKRWLERLPQAEVEQNPDLCVHAALHLFFLVLEEAGGLAGKERIDHLLQVAEEHWRNTNTTAKLAKIFAFRALLARQEGNPPRLRPGPDRHWPGFLRRDLPGVSWP